MKQLYIKGTRQTPDVDFNYDKGILELKGRSIPENTYEYFAPLVDWVEEYAKAPKTNTVMKVYLEYFNTSSSKFILELFKKLRPITELKGYNIVVEWYYDEDDEEMMETGEDYEDVSKLPFKLIEIVE